MKEKKKKTHYKPKPPNLPSFTACGLWIYHVLTKTEKQVTSVKKDVDCERCRNTKEFKQN